MPFLGTGHRRNCSCVLCTRLLKETLSFPDISNVFLHACHVEAVLTEQFEMDLQVVVAEDILFDSKLLLQQLQCLSMLALRKIDSCNIALGLGHN